MGSEMCIRDSPSIVISAQNELQMRVGEDFKYKALLGDRKPPLSYRVN